MLSIIEAAGWPIWFIIFTSIVALAIIGERFWSLRSPRVAPRELLPETIREYREKGVTPDLLAMGMVFALLMGAVGGLPPAIRAARANVAHTLRAL